MSVLTHPRAARAARFRSAPLRAAVLAVSAGALVVALDPEHTHVPLCPFNATTGLQCPLCGSLRAVNNLARGRVGAAVHDNILFVAALPVIALLWLGWMRRSRVGRPAPAWPRWATVAVVVLGVAFTIVRNLPGAEALRPA